MMIFMIFLLALIFLLHVPVVNTFRSYGFYDKVASAPWTLDSVGSMGFSDSYCELHSMVKGSKSNVTCAAGVVHKLVAFGVHTDAEDQRQCLRSRASSCDQYLDDKKAFSHFKQHCLGKTECTLPGIEEFMIQSTGADFRHCSRPSSKFYFQWQCTQTHQ
jgi:hypothetical protein